MHTTGTMADFRVSSQSAGLVLLEPVTPAGEAWATANLPAATWCQGAAVIEPRYWPAILDAIEGAGLRVQR